MDTDAVALTGVPADYEPLLTLIIAWAAAWLTGPLTAIAKKLGATSGPTTVGVSAVLSLLAAVGFSLALNQGQASVQQVILAAVVAFLRANGDYIRGKQVREGAAPDSAPQVRRLE